MVDAEMLGEHEVAPGAPEWYTGIDQESLKRAVETKYAPVQLPHGRAPCLIRLLQWLLFFTLAPLRLLTICLAFALGASWCLVCTLGFDAWDAKLQDTRPLPSCRRSLIYKVVGLGARIVLFVLGFVRIRVKGRENIPRNARHQNITIVCNHISLMDCLYLTYRFCPAFVVKVGVKSWPLFGYIATSLQAIYVDRSGSKGMYGGTTERLLKRQGRPNRGNIVCFPEGTTVNDRYLIKFRTGAFVKGETVYPVVLRYPFRWTSPMFGPESAMQTLTRLACSLYWSMEVTHLPAYEPSEKEQADPDLFARNVRAVMAAAMNDPPVRVSDISNVDLLKFWKDYVVAGKLPQELLTAEEFAKYSLEEPHLLMPTRQAREAAPAYCPITAWA